MAQQSTTTPSTLTLPGGTPENWQETPLTGLTAAQAEALRKEGKGNDSMP